MEKTNERRGAEAAPDLQLQVSQIPISELKHDSKNPRTESKLQIHKLPKNIKKFGFFFASG
jgi:hypothetical protein